MGLTCQIHGADYVRPFCTVTVEQCAVEGWRKGRGGPVGVVGGRQGGGDDRGRQVKVIHVMNRSEPRVSEWRHADPSPLILRSRRDVSLTCDVRPARNSEEQVVHVRDCHKEIHKRRVGDVVTAQVHSNGGTSLGAYCHYLTREACVVGSRPKYYKL